MLTSIQYEDQNDKQLAERAGDLLTLAEIWFERDDATQAEIYVNKCSHIIYDSRIKKEEDRLRYKQAFTKVSDSKRDYINAA